MSIFDITLHNYRLERDRANITWVFADGDRPTGPRWLYLELPDGMYISGMTGNPVDDFEITEVLRPATLAEIDLLNFMSEKLKFKEKHHDL